MKYHLIGIGGISMSALADLLIAKGHEVTGSDLKLSGHSASNINKSIDVVVRTSAVSPGSAGWVEVEAAVKMQIPVIKRSELLGQITNDYELIAISGMHGKTTTTSLAGIAFINGNMDPTVLVGEHIKEFDGSPLRLGKSKYFIFEACEYDRSFLDFYPSTLILTNIDEEHLDTYPGGLPEIKEAFGQYLKNIRPGGLLIANRADENIREIVEADQGDYRVIWYGLGSEEYHTLDKEMVLTGDHNRTNALAVEALVDAYNIPNEAFEQTLKQFKGAKRRLEYWGEYNQAMLYDDYGHHPTEIAATINAIKEKHPGLKLHVIFWPHQYKRIKPLLAQFAQAFEGADMVMVKEIFFVPGRDEILDVSSDDLAELISKSGIAAISFKENQDIRAEIEKLSQEKCILLTIGIPPIYKLWDEILGE